MENEPQPPAIIDTSKMQAINTIDNAFLHKFGKQNLRQIVDICECQILQHASTEATQLPEHYVKVGDMVQRMDDCIFVRATFQNLITYVFECKQNNRCLYLLSFETYNPNVQSFCQTINQSCQVVQFNTDNYSKTHLKQKIDQICGGELSQQMIENVGQLSTVFKTVGSLFGSVAKNIADPAVRAQQMINSGIITIKQKYVSEQNKNRWNMIKQGASNINQKMTEYYKPIDTAFKALAQYIGDNFNKSDNKYIKTFKKIGVATAKTLNNSYKRAEQTFVVGNSNGNNNSLEEKQNASNPPAQHEQSTNTFKV